MKNFGRNIERITVSSADFWACVDQRQRLTVQSSQQPTSVADWNVPNSRADSYDPHPFGGRFLVNSGYVGQLQAFVQAIHGGEAPRATLATARETQALADAITAKAKEVTT